MDKTFLDLGDKIQINVDSLKPNTVLNCPTYDNEGNEIQSAYSPFTEENIKKLIADKITKIYYNKPKNADNVIYQKNLKDYLKKNVYQGPRSIQVDTQEKAVHVMENILDKLKNRSTFDVKEAYALMDCILKDMDESSVEIINLLDIQSFDDYTYTHALNVGVIGMSFAKKNNMPDSIVKHIGLGGFLHDIGKIKLPFDLLQKTKELTEQETQLLRNHSRYGYEILKDSSELNELVKKIVLLHHEKFDGTGYPFGFKGDQLEDPISIIALAEVYDTLTSQLPYCDPIAPKEALKTILKHAGVYFKPELAHQFAKTMGHLLKESGFYEINDHVLLNTNEIGKIIAKDSDLTSRPSIEIVINAHGKELVKPLSVNLSFDNSRNIIRIINGSEMEEHIMKLRLEDSKT